MSDEIGLMIAYEMGELSDEGLLELFSSLIKSGKVWQLQGVYGRTAKALIDNEYISKNGDINYGKFNKQKTS